MRLFLILKIQVNNREALRNPSAIVVGSDLSAIEPQLYLSPLQLKDTRLIFQEYHRTVNSKLMTQKTNGVCYFCIAIFSWRTHSNIHILYPEIRLHHSRAMTTCFKSPLNVFKYAFNYLDPGGYFEMHEIYFRPHSSNGIITDTTLEKWNAKVVDGAAKMGKHWWCTPNYAGWFRRLALSKLRSSSLFNQGIRSRRVGSRRRWG